MTKLDEAYNRVLAKAAVKTRLYRGKAITKLFPSGYYEVYSDGQGRFLKFDSLAGAKELIDSEVAKSPRATGRARFQYPSPIRAIYDNDGKTADRYTVILDPKQGFPKERDGLYQALGLSDNPSHPQGVSMFTSSAMGRHLGRKISWEELPAKVQKHVTDRLR